MATTREDPYGAFNYKITITPDSGGEIKGAFAEVSGMSNEITYAEYRDGNEPTNRVRKVPLMYKVGDITLKRGLVGGMDLWTWCDQVRTGQPNTRASVVIELLDESKANTAMTWTLSGARPSKWSGPSLSAKGTDVAMEEMVLVCEDMKIE